MELAEELRAKQRACKGSARMDAWRLYGQAAAQIEDQARQIAELTAERDGALEKANIAILDAAAMCGALEDLISAARGMPISHDNLCQGTLDHAIKEADKALTTDAGEKAAKVLEAVGEYMKGKAEYLAPGNKSSVPYVRGERILDAAWVAYRASREGNDG